jgi:hypothetical protein
MSCHFICRFQNVFLRKSPLGTSKHEVLSSNSSNDKKQTNKLSFARSLWLKSIVLATWVAEIRRMSVQSHPRQIVVETPYLENTQHSICLASLKMQSKEE